MKRLKTLSQNVLVLAALSLFPAVASAGGNIEAQTGNQGLNDPAVNSAVLSMLSTTQKNRYWATQWTMMAALRKNSPQAQKIIKTISKINQISNSDTASRVKLIKKMDDAAASADGDLSRYLVALQEIEQSSYASSPRNGQRS